MSFSTPFPLPRQHLFHPSVIQFCKRTKKEKWHFCLLKIATQGVALWHFRVYMYHNPNWFIFIFLKNFTYFFTLYNFIILHGQIMYHYVYTPHFSYPFFSWWTSRSIVWQLQIVMLQTWYLSVSIVCWLTFLWIHDQSGISGPYGSFFLVYWRTSIVLSIMVALIYILTTVYRDSFFSASSPDPVVRVIDDSCSDWSKVKSQCCFDLHFLCS
jgi:hypothetical protein